MVPLLAKFGSRRSVNSRGFSTQTNPMKTPIIVWCLHDVARKTCKAVVISCHAISNQNMRFMPWGMQGNRIVWLPYLILLFHNNILFVVVRFSNCECMAYGNMTWNPVTLVNTSNHVKSTESRIYYSRRQCYGNILVVCFLNDLSKELFSLYHYCTLPVIGSRTKQKKYSKSQRLQLLDQNTTGLDLEPSPFETIVSKSMW